MSGRAGALIGVCPACALYSSGMGDRVRMEVGDRQGISSTFRCSSAKETTELLRGLWFPATVLPATVSMRGISMAVGAPSLRNDGFDRGLMFSSSAILGRRWFALTRRDVGGEVMLPPLFGEMTGDFAGLNLGQ